MSRRLWKGEYGQALVEMALVLPLFLLIMFGVFEMGRIGYAYITVTNAAREGGRIATLGGTDDQIKSSIEKAATSFGSMSLSIIITPLEDYRQSGQEVRVDVTYQVQLVIPIISNVITNPVIVSSSIVMRQE